MKIKEVLENNKKHWTSEDVSCVELVEIINDRLRWAIDAIDGCEDLDFHVESLLLIELIINDLKNNI
jgi:hypothetical protein